MNARVSLMWQTLDVLYFPFSNDILQFVLSIFFFVQLESNQVEGMEP